MSTEMYSQNDEEEYIIRFFSGHKGRFLDIGAYDGVTFSNTRRLFELGWTGVFVEPSPSIFPQLLKNYQDHDGRIKFMQAAVCRHNGEVKFFDSGGDAISTTEEAHREKWEKGANSSFTEMSVKCVTLDTILSLYGKDYAFINIDTESTNFDVLTQLRFDEVPELKMICIEHDFKIEEILTVCSRHGFIELARNAENLILVRPWNT